MSRLMSVAFTEEAVTARTKSVTRRSGWWLSKNGRRIVHVGDRLTLCRKVMGRKAGEPLVRLAEVEVVDVRREALCRMVEDLKYGYREVALEGFPDLTPLEFIHRFFIEAQGIDLRSDVTRIEWRYLDTRGQSETTLLDALGTAVDRAKAARMADR